MKTQIWPASWSPGRQGNQVRKGPTLSPAFPTAKALCTHRGWEKSAPACTSLPSQLLSLTIPQWVWGSFLWFQGLQLAGFLGVTLALGCSSSYPVVPIVCHMLSNPETTGSDLRLLSPVPGEET